MSTARMAYAATNVARFVWDGWLLISETQVSGLTSQVVFYVWGWDLALWAGRCYGGLTLGELGARVEGLDYTAVAMGVRRVASRARKDRALRSAMKRLAKECAM